MSQLGEGELLASNGQMLVLALTILQNIKQLPTTKNYLVKNVNGARVEKPQLNMASKTFPQRKL